MRRPELSYGAQTGPETSGRPSYIELMESSTYMAHRKTATKTRIAGKHCCECCGADVERICRTHVLKGTDPNDPMAPFLDLGVISTPDLNYMIDVGNKHV